MLDQKMSEEPGASVAKPSIYRRVRDYKLYPLAHTKRQSLHDPAVRLSRLSLVRAAVKNFILLQLLFFALFCYIFGSLYEQGQYVDQLNIAFVDYDGGAVGEVVRAAYANLRGSGFPSLQEKTPSEFPAPSVLRQDVCNIRYWGALYIAPGASNAIEASLIGTMETYDKSNILSYIWNEARYSAIVDSAISANLNLLSNTARVLYSSRNWTQSSISPDENTFATFADPWHLRSENIQSTTQGSRLVYNTLVIILILIQEFFYLGMLNQLYEAFKIYNKLNPHRIILFRNAFSLCYTLIGSLCVTATIWIFKAGWHVNGNQFALTWMVLWLFAHGNFLTLDIFTVWLPPPFVPMALITWVVLNVVSILLPFQLQSSFYLWAYAMPAHEVYNTLVDIWSSGCNPILQRSLPILFAYEISGLLFSSLGIHRRCHYAVIRGEAEQEAFQQRLDVAMAFQKKKRLEEKEKDMTGERTYEDGAEGSEIERQRSAEDAMEEEEEELESIISQDMERVKKMKSKMGAMTFGPSFGFGLGEPEDNDHSERASLAPTKSRKSAV